MAPAFAQAAHQLEPGYRLLKLDTDAQPATARRFAIRSIPTLILFHGGKEIARQSGAMDTPTLLRWLDGVFPTAS
jgi:thioredoxin 2